MAKSKSAQFIQRALAAEKQRQTLGIYEIEIARLCGCSQPGVHMILNEPHVGSWQLLRRVERAIGILAAEKIFTFGKLLSEAERTNSGAPAAFAVTGARVYQKWLAQKSEDSDIQEESA